MKFCWAAQTRAQRALWMHEDRDWAPGEQFSAADVVLGSSAVFMRMFEMLPDSVKRADYADCCEARPALARSLAVEETR